MSNFLFDRRTFLASTSLAAGGALTVVVLPMSSSVANRQAPNPAGADGEGSGHVDDDRGDGSPYSYPIPYGYALSAV